MLYARCALKRVQCNQRLKLLANSRAIHAAAPSSVHCPRLSNWSMGALERCFQCKHTGLNMDAHSLNEPSVRHYLRFNVLSRDDCDDLFERARARNKKVRSAKTT